MEVLGEKEQVISTETVAEFEETPTPSVVSRVVTRNASVLTDPGFYRTEVAEAYTAFDDDVEVADDEKSYQRDDTVSCLFNL